ncbi:MAG: hypothetical protein HYU51_09125 [Candidatus Rokubacteria bacterium]|nr:hypothetical protein [Candidatus Rokubacteria bacterium]
MTTWGDYRSCERSLGIPGADTPPRLLPYPDPCRPVRLLFIGGNPPCPGGGFWSRDDDRLLRSLHAIFLDLEWATADSPAPFREEFRQHGFHFIHAVKCFSTPRHPSAALVRTCALAHLREDLEHLRPERICLLGQVPFRAVKACDAEHLRRSFARQETTLSICGADVPMLVTYSPNDRRQSRADRRIASRRDGEDGRLSEHPRP